MRVDTVGLAAPKISSFEFAIGGLGVATFFIISGFIIVHSTFDQFGSATNALDFARKRFIRIAPIYWMATLLAYRPHVPLWQLALSCLFIPYSASPGASPRPVLGQGWTLNYEAFF